MARSAGPLNSPYNYLKVIANQSLKSKATHDAIYSLIKISLQFLNDRCNSTPLKSLVPEKEYVSYVLKTNTNLLSRPVNTSLFENDPSLIEKHWSNTSNLLPLQLARLYYTIGTAYAVASDLFDRNNKKAPATYFELLVGHIFANELQANPAKKALLELGSKQKVMMTMDFIFELKKTGKKLHLPVKASTRERVVQAWAHQRMLDTSYGKGTYKAILVVHSETKLDLQRREVIEITVPDQWLAYQTLLAKMDRIYYFDLPMRYLRLSEEFPIIKIMNFREFFLEKKRLGII